MLPASYPIGLEGARGLLSEADRRAAASGRPVLASLTREFPGLPDPVRIFTAAGRISETRTFFSQATEDWWYVGAGAATEISVDGNGRFQHALRAQRAILDSAVIEGVGDCGAAGPLFGGCFGFGPHAASAGPWQEIPNSLLILPRWTFFREGDRCWVTVNVLLRGRTSIDALGLELQSEADKLWMPVDEFFGSPITRVKEEFSFDDWRRGVEEILAEIRSGRLTKVTLARTLRLHSQALIRPEPVLRRLRTSYPGCLVFALSRPGFCFLGATPEELVRLKTGRVRSTCMAGSVWRDDAGGDDSSLENRLLSSDKERREHSVVADWVGDRMGRLCRELVRDHAPRVVKLGELQHLTTSFRGKPQEGRHVLEFVEALHPTPAVGGLPLQPALEAIRRLERHDRGWYAGPVGWMDRKGEGRFGIAIRSALLCGKEALLYAGAGIVEGSSRDTEYEETAMKLVPLLTALGVE